MPNHDRLINAALERIDHLVKQNDLALEAYNKKFSLLLKEIKKITTATFLDEPELTLAKLDQHINTLPEDLQKRIPRALYKECAVLLDKSSDLEEKLETTEEELCLALKVTIQFYKYLNHQTIKELHKELYANQDCHPFFEIHGEELEFRKDLCIAQSPKSWDQFKSYINKHDDITKKIKHYTELLDIAQSTQINLGNNFVLLAEIEKNIAKYQLIEILSKKKGENTTALLKKINRFLTAHIAQKKDCDDDIQEINDCKAKIEKEMISIMEDPANWIHLTIDKQGNIILTHDGQKKFQDKRATIAEQKEQIMLLKKPNSQDPFEETEEETKTNQYSFDYLDAARKVYGHMMNQGTKRDAPHPYILNSAIFSKATSTLKQMRVYYEKADNEAGLAFVKTESEAIETLRRQWIFSTNARNVRASTSLGKFALLQSSLPALPTKKETSKDPAPPSKSAAKLG